MSITDFGVWHSSTNAMIDFEEYNFIVRRGLAAPYSYLVRYNSTASVYEALYGDEEVAGQVAFGGEDNLGSTTGTNSAAVINAALDAVSGTAMERVVLQGTFSAVEAQLDITKSYTWLDLRQAHLTLNDSVDADLIEVGSTVDYFWIEGGYLNGNAANNAAGSCIKVNTGSNDFWIGDVYCTGGNDYGIQFVGTPTRGSLHNIYVESCTTGGIFILGSEHRLNLIQLQDNTNIGIEFGATSSRNTLANFQINDSTTDGIKFTSSIDNAIGTGSIHSNTQNGINVDSNSHRNAFGGGLRISDNGYNGMSLNGDWNKIGDVIFDTNSIGNNNTYDNLDIPSGAEYNNIVGNVFYSNGTITKYGIHNAADNNVIKSNTLYDHATAEIWNTAGNCSWDRHVMATASLDLSGANTDILCYHAQAPAHLAGYSILYTEASSADAGVNIVVGRYQDGVALDDNYFDTSTSEVSKNLGYRLNIGNGSMDQTAIIEGDSITVGTDGGKVGTGEVRLTLWIAEICDT